MIDILRRRAYSEFPNPVKIGDIWYSLNRTTNKATVVANPSGAADYTSTVSSPLIIPSNVPFRGILYSVETIAGRAFYGCTGLAAIDIPSSITQIGSSGNLYDAFTGCTNLKKVITNSTFGSGDRSSSSGAYYGDIYGGYVEEYEFGNNYTKLYKYMFFRDASVKKITVTASNFTTFDTCCVCQASNFEEINFPNTLTSFGGGANFQSTKLKGTIIIPSGITSIPSSTFQNTNITGVQIPNSVTSIGERAFSGCALLDGNLVITSNVTRVYNSAFTGTGISSLTIEGRTGNTLFYRYVFYNCVSLQSVTVGNGVVFGVDDFYGCSALTYVSTNTTSIGQEFRGRSSLETLVIGNLTTSIGNFAFYGCSSLSSVTLGDSIETLGSSAFAGCSNISSIILPNGLISIGGAAFQNCSRLETINIPNTVTTIGDTVFYGCTSLTAISIPDSVETLGTQAFSGCSKLETITIGDNVESIEDLCFYSCSKLSNVTLGSGLTKIGKNAFYGCKIQTIVLPNSLEIIDNSAFSYCSNLSSITIPDGVTSIGYSAFSHCRNLASVNIPTGITVLDDYVFGWCYGLRNISIPNNIVTIKRTFQDCTNLTSISVPNSVETISTLAFDNCTSLTTLIIGSGVTYIGESVSSRTPLRNVTCYAISPPTIESNSFNSIIAVANRTLSVPASALSDYQIQDWYDQFGTIQAITP